MKNFNMRIILLLMLIFISSQLTLAQVDDIKKRAEENKNARKKSSDSSSPDSESSIGDDLLAGCALELMKISFGLIYQEHVYQLEQRIEEPWRVSLEAKAIGGVDFGNKVFLNNPVIRGNWGLFSTQLRYTKIYDASGPLGTLDWQILQMNIANSNKVRITIGGGFSHEFEIGQTHAEWLGEFSIYPGKKVFVPTIIYRISGNGLPRQELSAHLEYRTNAANRISPTVTAGFTHQNWYGIPLNFAIVGLGLIIQ